MKNLFLLLISASLMFASCDPCDDTTCYNEANCDNGICQCTFEYEGTSCDELTRNKYMGDYSVIFTLQGVPDPVETIDLNAIPGSVTAFTLGSDLNMNLISVTEFEIPAQSFDSMTIQGEGSFDGDNISATATLFDGAFSVQIGLTGTKL